MLILNVLAVVTLRVLISLSRLIAQSKGLGTSYHAPCRYYMAGAYLVSYSRKGLTDQYGPLACGGTGLTVSLFEGPDIDFEGIRTFVVGFNC